MKKITGNIFVIIIILHPFFGFGQADQDNVALQFSIPGIAILDIEPASISEITLMLTADSEAGAEINYADAVNNDLWLNYTSAYATGNNNRSITVQIVSGTIPAGVNLSLSPSAYSGNGQGSFGTPVSLNLSALPQTVISGIGRCYTGDGQNNGHQLNYSLSISNYQDLNNISAATVQIVFTLIDN